MDEINNPLDESIPNTYWAAAPSDELVNHLVKKANDYIKYLETSGMLDELRKSYSLFYGNSAIQEYTDGKATMTVNHYASLVRGIHTMVTQNRPAFEARAINSDYDSQAITILANGLLDYYLRENGLENHLKRAAELSLFLREGWVVAEWNPQIGEDVAVNPDTNMPVKTGDVEFSVHGVLEIVRDVRNSGEHQWYIIRRRKNKFDLSAQFPEKKTEIENVTMKTIDEERWTLSLVDKYSVDTDMVDYWTFMHAKTPSMPQGRIMTYVGNVWLTDGPLPYAKPNVFGLKATDAYQTAFGHSNLMDCIPMQDALDTAFSVALSNINSFGVGNLVSEKGSIAISQLKEGLLHVQYNKGSEAPQMLNMLQIPPEIFTFADSMIRNQETVSGLNAVARGDTPHQMSGTAMALVAQQALTFSSGVQQSYNMLLESTGSSLIELLQTYATVPRIAYIAGKTKKAYMRKFQGTDLQGISRIIVESSNALTKTTAGKVEVANQLLNTGLITTPEQYLQVVETGTLEPLVEHDQAQLMLIREENEILSDGGQVMAIMTDKHDLHILEHSTVLSSPVVRQNPQVVQAALAHIQEHIDLAKTADPILMMMLKQQPLAQPMPPPGPPPGNPNMPSQPPSTMQDAPVPEPAQPPPNTPPPPNGGPNG